MTLDRSVTSAIIGISLWRYLVAGLTLGKGAATLLGGNWQMGALMNRLNIILTVALMLVLGILLGTVVWTKQGNKPVGKPTELASKQGVLP